MHIVFTLYDGMTPLDLVGPFQVLALAPEMRVSLAASRPGPKQPDPGLVIHAD